MTEYLVLICVLAWLTLAAYLTRPRAPKKRPEFASEEWQISELVRMYREGGDRR